MNYIIILFTVLIAISGFPTISFAEENIHDTEYYDALEILNLDDNTGYKTEDIYSTKSTFYLPESGRRFSIPNAYLSYFDAQSQSKDNTQQVSLIYSYPSRISAYEYILDASIPKDQQEPLFNISFADGVDGYDEELEDTISYGAKKAEPATIYDLNHYIEHRDDGEDWPDKVYNYYFEMQNTQVKSVIICNEEHICIHTFNDKNLSYSYFFPENEVSKWKELQQKTIEFVEQYEVKEQK